MIFYLHSRREIWFHSRTLFNLAESYVVLLHTNLKHAAKIAPNSSPGPDFHSVAL